MRLVIITVGLVVFLGAGLAAITWILSNFESLSEVEEVQTLTSGQVTLDGLPFPVNVAAALDHYVAVDLRLEIADARRQAEIEAVLPRIRDAILRDAHRAVPRRPDGIDSIDLVRVKDRAKTVANEVLGGEVVTKVLVTRVAKLVA